MANNGEFISVLETNAIKDVQTLNSELKKTVDGINAANNAFKGFTIPSEAKNYLNQLNALLANNSAIMEKQIQIRNRSNGSIDRERLAELKLQSDREKAFAKYDALQAKKQAAADKIAAKAESDAQRQITAEKRIAAQELADQKAREAQLLRESNLRDRLAQQRAREEAAAARIAGQGGRTQEEITNTRLLAANASRAAQANSTFANSYERLSAQQNIASRAVQNLIARGRTGTQTQKEYNKELAAAQRQFDSLNTRVAAADRAVGRFNRNVGNYPMQAVRGLKDLLMAFGVVGGVQAFAAITKDIFNTTKELQSLDFALKQVIGSNEAFGQSQAFLQRISEAYGIEIKGLTSSYTGFYAASKNAIDAGAISADQINEIFESVSKASGAIGLSVEQQKGAFLALQQMISKGNVQAEEIRGQLAERLPGAFGILAKSMGVTEVQLNKLLKDGKVLAAEVLPAFAKELEKAYGVENLNRVENLTAETTRLSNAWTEFIRALNDGDGVFSGVLVSLIASLKEALNFYSQLLKSDRSKINETSAKAESAAYDLQIKQLKELEEQTRKNYAADQLSSTDAKLKSLTEQNAAIKENIRLLEASKKEALKNDYMFGFSKTVRTLKGGIATENKDLAANQNELSVLQGSRRAWEEILKVQKKVDYVGAARVKRQKADIDYLKEIFNLQKQNTENHIADEEQIMNNEEKNYATRLAAANNYYFQKEALLKLEHDEEIRLNKLENDNQNETYRTAISEGKATQSNLDEINYKFIIKKKRLDEKYEYDKTKLTVESARKLQGVLLDIQAQNARNTQNRLGLGDTAERNSLLGSSTAETTIKQFTELENKYRDLDAAAMDRADNLTRIDLERTKAEIERVKLQEPNIENNQKINELTKEQIGYEQQLLDTQTERLQAVENLRIEMKSATDELFNSIKSGFLSDLGLGSLTKFTDQVTYDFINAAGEIETKTGSTFDKMLDQAQTAGEKLKVVGLEAMSAFQEVFNFLQQNNQARFDAELTNIEREYEIRKKFAGGNADAEEELERQLADKKREIRVREAKAAKETALFNAIINTASAVVAALPNIGASILVGALGAIQIGLIASKPLPAYAEGTDNHPGGRAIVGDGGKHEVIRYPDGRMALTPNKDTLIDLPKGSQVYPDIASSGILGSGLPAVAMNRIEGVSASDMERIMNKTLAKMPVNNLVADAEGLRAYSERQGQRTEYKNRTVRFEGRKIR